ncbi:MAG TPA: DUF1491 family protein [Aestuariivirgaceae bacterium]|nr:DUF1491 family protein [Aestuariivirgaceae bacterium]
MSVKAAIWCEAYLRRCNAAGHFAALVRRGAEEAGSIFIKVNRLDGRVTLYGPPPGPAHDIEGERRWQPLLGSEPVPERDADDYLARIRKIDPDIWILEVEDRSGHGLLRVTPG